MQTQDIRPTKVAGLSDYYCFVLVRDGQDTIDATLGSLVWQTHAAHKIIVINDGSTDRTTEIVEGYAKDYPDMFIVHNTGSKTRDYRRLVKLWNVSMSIADKTMHEGKSCNVHCAYHMISGGDSRYHPQYAEKLVTFMDAHKEYAVCSGDYGERKAIAPHGAGRFVRQDFFYDNYRQYPEIIGYESEILLRAMFAGHKTKVLNDARYDHLDKLGHSHNFVEFGYAMRALGYYFPYVLGKVALESAGGIGPAGAFNILRSYLTYKPQGGYYSLFPEGFRQTVREHQKRMILRKLGL